ncbi:hypothetical protein FUT69_09065 [Xylella taiwanensis]|nr:hypothetical protein [Xylella taiwanensis]
MFSISVQMRYFSMHKMLLGRCDLWCMEQNPRVGLCVVSHSSIVRICQAVEYSDGEYTLINALLQYMARLPWVLCSSQIEWVLLLLRLAPVPRSESNVVIAEPVALSCVFLFHGEQNEALLIAASVQGCDSLFGVLALPQRDRLRIGCRHDYCCLEVPGHSGEVMI